ncbi:hypothetical protein [Salinispora tropica]|uniref:Uncharacterized protein n=1 Tax=Salinispora tropica (strain ATCC BAA-916 / DSM 44818 / JCM 13857 / NBRC 105044 / CNB-440) TaxID=369723 RepID=A4XBF9_SALTO|nr:hypothetical protein [Salinispora tropica]ABP56258.1 hypothetical protein Strop_3827 [Salinispora tropica CNB-440]
MKAHRTDSVSLFFGLFFLLLAAWWLVARLRELTLPPVGWFLAAALLLIGVLGLVGALRAARSGSPSAPEAKAPPTAAMPEPGPAEGDRR